LDLKSLRWDLHSENEDTIHVQAGDLLISRQDPFHLIVLDDYQLKLFLLNLI
jgi:hypothetical protein